MKLFHIAAAILLAITASTFQSCSSAEEAAPKNIDGHLLMSRSDAQAQLDDLLDSNAYLDLDMSKHVFNNTREFTDYDILSRAIYYRFYQKTRIENNRVVVDGTAADINISERAFNHCIKGHVEACNRMIVTYMSMGYTPEEAVKKAHHVTPESIARIRVLR